MRACRQVATSTRVHGNRGVARRPLPGRSRRATLETTDFGDRDDVARTGRHDGSRNRRTNRLAW